MRQARLLDGASEDDIQAGVLVALVGCGMTLEQIWCKPALVLEAAPPPPAREAAIRRETPQFLVEQATQGAQEQLRGAGPVPGGVLLDLVPRSGDLGGAEQRVPVVGEVARIARQDFI